MRPGPRRSLGWADIAGLVVAGSIVFGLGALFKWTTSPTQRSELTIAVESLSPWLTIVMAILAVLVAGALLTRLGGATGR